jgi:hypothetical protein
MSSVTHLPQHTIAAQTTLPVDWYISPEIYAAEQQLLFANTPKYVGHQLNVDGLSHFCLSIHKPAHTYTKQ